MDRLFLKIFLTLLAVQCSGHLEAQDTTYKVLAPIDVTSKKAGFKKMGLYDNELEEDFNVRGFAQLAIFKEDLTDEFWTSGGKNCIEGKMLGTAEESFLSLRWNKDLDECDWVGMGFGWDGWTGKDMGYVADTLAIELIVRSKGKPFSNIPWAFCIEDYGGKQAWLGYNKSFLIGKEISTDWTRVEIPLSLFPFAENEVDLTAVKQLMIQVFSEGEIEIKSIQLIPFSKKLKQEVHASRAGKRPVIDGKLSDWLTSFTTFGSGHQFALTYLQDSLFLAIKVVDSTPNLNGKTGNSLWNGDAIEIAFATNPQADVKRKFLLLSDQHIGINCGDKPYIWDWKEDVLLSTIQFAIAPSSTGYNVELVIPFETLYQLNLQSGISLDFEIAVDLGDAEARQQQDCWNSGTESGFHTSPKKWGVLIFD